MMEMQAPTITILILALLITHGNCCDCPTGYQSGESCRITLQRLPCNITVPTCKCPNDYTATPHTESYYICKKGNTETQCHNHEELQNFVTKLAADSTWNLPEDQCSCQDNFKVMRNGNRILCENPHSYWIEIPCGLRAPPICKCNEGMIYGLSEDGKKAEYNSVYGCVRRNGKVESCLNENEIRKYYLDVLKNF